MFDGLGIIMSFFAGFVHTERGVTCSDSRFIELSTAQECKLLGLTYAKSFNSKAYYRSEGSWSHNPKGCYIYDSGTMHFNTHSTGGSKSSTMSICRNGNT